MNFLILIVLGIIWRNTIKNTKYNKHVLDVILCGSNGLSREDTAELLEKLQTDILSEFNKENES